VSGLVNAEGAFSQDLPLASPYVRQSDEDPELDARAKQGRKRAFISSRVLTSAHAIRELEARTQAKPQRRAGRVRRGLVEAAPPPPRQAGIRETRETREAGDAGDFGVADEAEYEGWRQVAALALPPDLDDDDGLEMTVE
jgi:hypothetical protein